MKAAKDLTHQQACDLVEKIQKVCLVAQTVKVDGSDEAVGRDLLAYDDVVAKLQQADLL
jgi:hypothetical protein